jgi:hypothetical protein
MQLSSPKTTLIVLATMVALSQASIAPANRLGQHTSSSSVQTAEPSERSHSLERTYRIWTTQHSNDNIKVGGSCFQVDKILQSKRQGRQLGQNLADQ